MAVIIGDDTINDDLSSDVSGDVILGLGGDDVLAANADHITLDGGAGNDQLFSFVGDSTLIGGAGNDELFAFGANETASYEHASAGISVDLSAQAAEDDGDGGSDLLFGVENVTGSMSNDVIVGNGQANVLRGLAGDDLLTGGGGVDFFKFSFDLESASSGGDVPRPFGEWLGSEHALNIAILSQNEFVQNYKEWLGYLADELRENHGFDTIPENAKVSFKQNDPGDTPQIEGLTQTQLGEIFGDATAISVKTGKTSQARYYSDIDTNSDVWGSSEDDVVTSGDGFDSIVDFGNGADKIRFDFTAAADWDAGFADNDAKLAFLEGFFDIAPADLFGGDGANDSTRIQFASEVQTPVNDPADDTWAVTLEATSSTNAQVFAALDIYVNDVLIG